MTSQAKSNHDKWGILLVFLLSLIPLFALIKPGMFVAHDSKAHIVRIASFYQSLSEGNLIPRWSQTLNAGYGHPIFMFLYPLSSYVSSLFHFLGLSISSSIKLLLSITYLGSGFFMYLWLKKHFNQNASVIGALVFQFAPYRFVNLYVRNALGEHTAFMFIPLVLLAFYKLIKKPSFKKVAFAATSVAGLILAHNAVSLMFLPILVMYSVILIWQRPRNKLLAINCWLLTVGLGLSLAAFFWLPALFEGKYTLRSVLLDKNTFADHFPSLWQLLIPTWGYGNSYKGFDDDLSLQIGLIQWLAVIVGATLVIKKWPKLNLRLKWLNLLAVIIFASSLILLLRISTPLWHLLPIIKKFQFPWRLLILPVFSSSILAALVIEFLLGRWRSSTPPKWNALLLAAIILGLLVQNHRYWKPQGETLPEDNQVISEYLGTTDTGESTPLWATRFQEKRPDDILGVVHGAPITYEIFTRESEFHRHSITASVPTQVSENTLYFPGWKAYIDDKEVPIIFEDQNWRGVITYLVPKGTHTVKVVFEETKLRQFANSISMLSFILLALVAALPAYKGLKKP